MGVTERPRSLNPSKAIAMAICLIIVHFSTWRARSMHDVACEFAGAVVRSKDAQKQLARTSLSTRVFKTRTATRSELFSLLTCPHTTTFTLLSIFSPLETSSIKIWVTIGSSNAKCSFPVAVRVSKTCVLKLPNVSEEEINLMKENAIPRNTKHATKLGMTLFKGKM